MRSISTREVGSSISIPLAVTGGLLSSSSGRGGDPTAASDSNSGRSVPCGRKRPSVPLRGRMGHLPFPRLGFLAILSHVGVVLGIVKIVINLTLTSGLYHSACSCTIKSRYIGEAIYKNEAVGQCRHGR